MRDPDSPQLSESQVQAFRYEDTEGNRDKLKRLAEAQIELARTDRDAPLAILDLGGGDGRVLDALLEALPRARGVLVDASPSLVAANTPHPRKEIIQGDIFALDALLPEGRRYDLVSLCLILHHLVGRTRAESDANQVAILQQCRRLLAPGGTLLVEEQVKQSPLLPDMANAIAYRMTASRGLARLARRLGANTAGTGVLFGSDRRWRRVFRRAGLEVAGSRCFKEDPLTWAERLCGYVHSEKRLYALRPA